MKKLLGLLLPALFVASCSEGIESRMDPVSPDIEGEVKVSHEMIQLGSKLENPYTVKNFSSALASVYPTRGVTEVPATDLYVRFLPKSEEDMEALDALGLDLFDYPLDYEVKVYGDYYHDPSLGEGEISWQYAVVPAGFEFPEGIEVEILDECFIPVEGAVTRGYEDVDWELVEMAAYEETGNAGMLVPETRGRKSRPAGRITIEDSSNGIVGVSGVKIMANCFVKYSYDYTDADGYYEVKSKFSSKPHYQIRFRNSKGFNIGFNKVLVLASTSNLGKGSPQGLSVTVTPKDDAMFRRCVVNNAGYDYYEKCESYGIPLPDDNLRLWILAHTRPSSAVMMHHGAALSWIPEFSKYLDIYKMIVRVFAPDITIGASDKTKSYGRLYAATIHEMAHASHFKKVGIDYWDRLVGYTLKNFFATGKCYGSANGKNSGYCGVAEMWAFFIENSFYKDRYGSSPGFGHDYWFAPQVLEKLEESGISKSEMMSAMKGNVHEISNFSKSLQNVRPDKKSVIQKVFKEYFE